MIQKEKVNITQEGGELEWQREKECSDWQGRYEHQYHDL
jgi:hypothetical protein